MIKNITLAILCIFSTITLSGQYKNTWQVGTKIGLSSGLNEDGIGHYYGLSLQRNVGLGIALNIEYGSGFYQKSIDASSFADLTETQISSQQFNNIFLGIKKNLQVSNNSFINLGFNAGIVNRNILFRENPNNRNLELNSQNILVGTQSEFSYQIAGEYLVDISESISGGIFANFQSQPENFQLGLRTYVLLNSTEELKTDKNRSSHWWMEWAIGAFGGDGTPTMTNFDIYIGRSIIKSLSAYFRYSVGSKSVEDGFTPQLFSLSIENAELFREQFLIDNDDSELDPGLPSTSSSFALGLKYKINGSKRSELLASSGISFFKGDFVALGSFSPGDLQLMDYRVSSFSDILAEIGIHYNYNITESLYLGGKVTMAFGRINIGAAFHTGFRF